MPPSVDPRVALGPGSRFARPGHESGLVSRTSERAARAKIRDPGVTPRLVCVPSDRAAAVWPHVRALIHAAMKRGDLSSFRPVEAAVLAGDALLWLAWDGTRIQAAAVTELHATEWRKVCVLVACGGAGVNRWIALLDGIEAYARAAGCAAVRIMGRKGWMRLLGDYRVKRIVLEKDL
jgi:hypothetical protein